MDIVKSKIGNAITSAAIDHVVATSDDIFDNSLDMYQEEVNNTIVTGIEELHNEHENILSGVELACQTIIDAINAIDTKEELDTIVELINTSTSELTQAIISKSETIINKSDAILTSIGTAQSGIENTVNAQGESTRNDLTEKIDSSKSDILSPINTLSRNTALYKTDIINSISNCELNTVNTITANSNTIINKIDTQSGTLSEVNGKCVDIISKVDKQSGTLSEINGKTGDIINLVNGMVTLMDAKTGDILNGQATQTTNIKDYTYIQTNSLITHTNTLYGNIMANMASNSKLDAQTKTLQDTINSDYSNIMSNLASKNDLDSKTKLLEAKINSACTYTQANNMYSNLMQTVATSKGVAAWGDTITGKTDSAETNIIAAINELKQDTESKLDEILTILSGINTTENTDITDNTEQTN